MDYIKHPSALVESHAIGSGTAIGAFVHVSPDVRIGTNCTISDHVVIQGPVTIGANVSIAAGARLTGLLTIEDGVQVGANAILGSPAFPALGNASSTRFEPTVIRAAGWLGSNAVVLAGVEISQRAQVGAGAVVTRNVPPNAVVEGNPARITGYVDTPFFEGTGALAPQPQGRVGMRPSAVRGVGVYELPLIRDLRGDLSFAECRQYLPFSPERYFLVFGVPSKELRGEHAHRQCHQFLVCVHGSCSLVVDDTKTREEVLLDRPNLGVHIPPMVWGIQYKYSADAVLMVLASQTYSAADYIRNYDEYVDAVGAH